MEWMEQRGGKERSLYLAFTHHRRLAAARRPAHDRDGVGLDQEEEGVAVKVKEGREDVG